MNPDLSDKYRQFVESANSIMLGMDLQGNITFFNKFAQDFFGFSETEIIGKNVIGTIVPASDYAGHDLRNMITDIMHSPQKHINNENENITHDGRHSWISWTNKPIVDQNGKLIEVLSIGNDISRLKLAEIELEKAKELSEAAGQAGIIICTADWKIKSINSAARRFLHQENILPVSLDVISLMQNYYQLSVSPDKIKDPTCQQLNFDLVRPENENNKALYLEANREIIISPAQKVISIVFALHDVTNQRKEELLKQDFLGLISHKLRTPITVILQSTLLLQQDKTSQMSGMQKALLDGMADEANKLSSLISNLLNFVTINGKNMLTSLELISPCQQIPKVIQPLIALQKGKKVNIKTEYLDKNIQLKMNKTYFDLIISNLVDNAIKFNDKDPVEISFSSSKEGNNTILTISDNGPGLALEEQDKVFNGFYQSEKCFTGNVAGAGLGLPLVKKIVHAYGGNISLKSEIGLGATFGISLPQNI
ncbi:MAG: PAS domain-containing sensor histidine kinase [Candidatus Margulisiibacteriota bacterium]